MALTYNSTTDKWTDSFTINKQTGTTLTLATNDKYVNGNIEFAIDAKPASPTFKGGAVSGTATADNDNCAISTSTNNSGVSIIAKASATRAKVQYNTAVDGWVTKNASADAYAAESAIPLTPTTYYINGVTIGVSKNFNITIPNGTTTPNLILNFEVDAEGNVLVT